MPTIQVREIPMDAYEILRKRARLSGRSIQSYMRELVVEIASRPTKLEALSAIDANLQSVKKTSIASILKDLRSDRL